MPNGSYVAGITMNKESEKQTSSKALSFQYPKRTECCIQCPHSDVFLRKRSLKQHAIPHMSVALHKHAHTDTAEIEIGQKTKVKRNYCDISRAKETDKVCVLTTETSNSPVQYQASALKSKVKPNQKSKLSFKKFYKCKHCDDLLKTKQLKKLHEITHYKNVSPQTFNAVHEESPYQGQFTWTHSGSELRKCKCCCSHHGSYSDIIAQDAMNARRESCGHIGCNSIVQPDEKFQIPGKGFQSVDPQNSMGTKCFQEQSKCMPRRFDCTHSLNLQECSQCKFRVDTHEHCARQGSVFINHKADHSKTLLDEESLNCRYCLDVVSQSLTINYLSVSFTPGMLYECRNCRASFKEKMDLKKHIKSHPGVKPYQCLLCDSQHFSRKKLREHCKMHKEHEFIQNQTSSSSLGSPKRHLRSDCGKLKNTQKDNKVESGLNKCDIISLNFQMKYYQGGMLFECKVCKAVYRTKKNVKKHIKNHDGEKTYKCTHCLTQFFGKKKVKNHILEHVRDKVCGSAHFENAFAKLLLDRSKNACSRMLNDSKSKRQESGEGNWMSSHAYPEERTSNETGTWPQEGLNVSIQNKRKKTVDSQPFLSQTENCSVQDSFPTFDLNCKRQISGSKAAERLQGKKRKKSHTPKENRIHMNGREIVNNEKLVQATQEKHAECEVEMRRGNDGTFLMENSDDYIEGDSVSEILGLESIDFCDTKREAKTEVDKNLEDSGSGIDTQVADNNSRLEVNDNPNILIKKENSDVECEITTENVCTFHGFKEEKLDLDQEIALAEAHCSLEESSTLEGNEAQQEVIDSHSDARVECNVGGSCPLNKSQSSLVSEESKSSSESVLKSPTKQKTTCPLCGSGSLQVQSVFGQEHYKEKSINSEKEKLSEVILSATPEIMARKVLELLPECLVKLQQVANRVDDLSIILRRVEDFHALSEAVPAESQVPCNNQSESVNNVTSVAATSASVGDKFALTADATTTAGTSVDICSTVTTKGDIIVSDGQHSDSRQMLEINSSPTEIQDEARNANYGISEPLEMETKVSNTEAVPAESRVPCNNQPESVNNVTSVAAISASVGDEFTLTADATTTAGTNIDICSTVTSKDDINVIGGQHSDNLQILEIGSSPTEAVPAESQVPCNNQLESVNNVTSVAATSASVGDEFTPTAGATTTAGTNVDICSTVTTKDDIIVSDGQHLENQQILEISSSLTGGTAEVHGTNGKGEPNTTRQEASLVQSSFLKDSRDGIFNDKMLCDFQLYLQKHCKMKSDHYIHKDVCNIGNLFRFLYSALNIPFFKDIDYTLLFRIDLVRDYYKKLRGNPKPVLYSLSWFISYIGEQIEYNGMQNKIKPSGVHLVHKNASCGGDGLSKLRQFLALNKDMMNDRESMKDFIEGPQKNKQIQNYLADFKIWYEKSMYNQTNYWHTLDKYSFILGYIINYLVINCDIHHLIVKNMTVTDVLSAIPSQENTKGSKAIITVHCNDKWRLKDGKIILDTDFYKIMMIYLACYRKAHQKVIWFLTEYNKQISDFGALINQFRKKFELRLLNCGYDYNRRLFNATLPP